MHSSIADLLLNSAISSHTGLLFKLNPIKEALRIGKLITGNGHVVTLKKSNIFGCTQSDTNPLESGE
jgi:hypothetical protein